MNEEAASAPDHAPPAVTAATVWRDVPEPNRSLTIDGFGGQTNAAPVAAFCHQKDFYSRLILDVLEIDRVERGRISCFASVKSLMFLLDSMEELWLPLQRRYQIDCVRIVVAEDKGLFLGELVMSYLAAAP